MTDSEFFTLLLTVVPAIVPTASVLMIVITGSDCLMSGNSVAVVVEPVMVVINESDGSNF